MKNSTAVVVTSINRPNAILTALADGCARAAWSFYLVGDKKSPQDFALEHCRFFSVEAQLESGFTFPKKCPVNHYARKNIGYLLALRDGASIIVETDDDNIPEKDFWKPRTRKSRLPTLKSAGWTNAYAHFTEKLIWPRGLPLPAIQTSPSEFSALPVADVDCPIQQGLADDNPDVDAIYRLIYRDPIKFRRDRRVALGSGSWCPFNSQNTTWWPDAFPLLYLPAYCSFRMTDIWRSFVAQRIGWENGWSVLFHEPTVRQERNAHDLMRDFNDEVPGYLNNQKIGKILGDLSLRQGKDEIPDNLRRCYRTLVEEGIVASDELGLLEAWLLDLALLRVI